VNDLTATRVKPGEPGSSTFEVSFMGKRFRMTAESLDGSNLRRMKNSHAMARLARRSIVGYLNNRIGETVE
jgi:hypothetical protein